MLGGYSRVRKSAFIMGERLSRGRGRTGENRQKSRDDPAAGPMSVGQIRGDVRTVWISGVWPELGAGRFPVKRVVGETFEVSADILREGHEALAAVLKYRTVKDTGWREVPMRYADNDRWIGRFPLEENTRYLYTIEAYPNAYRSWAADLEKRLNAGMDVTSELLEGAALLRPALARAMGADK